MDVGFHERWDGSVCRSGTARIASSQRPPFDDDTIDRQLGVGPSETPRSSGGRSHGLTPGADWAQRAKRGAMDATSSSPIATLKTRSHFPRFRSRPIPTPKRVQSEAQG